MGNFQRGGRGGGGFKGGFRPGGGGRDFGDRDSRPRMMHEAVCASCGKKCEVPFRPSGDRPVYCKDCFGSKSDPGAGGFRPRERSGFGQGAPQAVSSQGGGVGNNEELKNQLVAINAKLERLITAVTALGKAPEPEAPTTKAPVVKAKAKKAAKKTK